MENRHAATDATVGPSGPMQAIVWWAAAQVLWLTSLAILPATIRRDIPEAWLYPAAADILIAVSAPVVAWALLRRRSGGTWLTAICWFAASAFIRVNEIAIVAKVDAPDNFIGGSRAAAISVLVAVALGHLAAVAVIAQPRVRLSFTGPANKGSDVGRAGRLLVASLAIWMLIQVFRFIAIAVIGDVMNEGADPAWLAPAIGDLIVAVPSVWLAWVVWRRRGPREWVLAVVYLVISIVDHLDTITGDARVPSPPTFARMDMPVPTWFAPLSQAVVDLILLVAILSVRGRRVFLRTGPARPSQQ